MVLSEFLLRSSCPYPSNLDRYESSMKVYESNDHDVFSTIVATPENSSISSVNFPTLSSDFGHDHDRVGMDKLEGFDDVCKWLCDDVDDNDDDDDGMEEGFVYVQDESLELDSQTGIKNLLMAYSEAMGKEQEKLVKVIVKCISEKTKWNGSPLERVARNLLALEENAYLYQESLRNFNSAFRAFYDIFPYARFAHLTAGSTILEFVPSHVDLVHVIDFDMCEGIQWPPVIEAVARIKKSLIITSIKLDQDQDSRFDQTSWHLCNFARSFGLSLKVQEMGMSQLVKKLNERKLGSVFLAFNCMTGLLHMGGTRTRIRKTTQVMEFLKTARACLAKNEGIITFGDGLEVERMKNHSDFSSFFNNNLARYNALYESMEWGFPSYLNEARIAMETLFLAPFVSSKSWFEKWEERRENAIFDKKFQKGFGFIGVRLSKQCLNEAMEMVKEGETPYRIRVEGENGNEMVLEWKETPLVRVCAWKVMK